jgi:D-3-phosphoglycerate dehydrogenase / 2-oxoglutarate reductase
MTQIFLTHTPRAREAYYGDRALQALRQLGDLAINPHEDPLDDPARLIAAAAGARIIVAARHTPIPAAVFAGMPDLLAVCRVAVDISTIDVEAASRQGVLVTRASAGFVAAVAELALGFMVDLARGVSTAVGAYRAGIAPPIRRGRQLQGATLGIIGYGAIGRRLAELGLALGMTVIVNDPYAEPTANVQMATLPSLLEAADFVVCLALATPETQNLMDDNAFTRMRRGAFFINLSRGGLVDEAALERALQTGRLGGVAMDVGRAPDEMPSLHLAGRPDVLATPHIGGLTQEAVEHQAFDSVRQVAEIVQGRMPPGAVNAESARRLFPASGR